MTRDELRTLAAARPERGRVLSVFLDLDPSQFATGDAKASAVNSALDDAERRIDAEDLDHDARMQLRAEVDRVRASVDPPHLAAGGAHGLADGELLGARLERVLGALGEHLGHGNGRDGGDQGERQRQVPAHADADVHVRSISPRTAWA